MVKILLFKFKDNISGLGICFKDGFYVFDYPSDLSDTEEINGESGLDKKVEEEDSLNFLLDPDLTFCALERLSVKFYDEMSSYDDYEEDEVEVPLIQVLINRHSKQIKELEIANLWGGCNLKLAHLESLTSLSLDKVDTYMALELLDDCRQKILKFKMTDIEFLDGNYDIGDMDLYALEISNLKHLHLHPKDIIISHLVSKNATRIESFLTNSNIVKFPLVPNLKILWINRASLEMLSKCHLTIQCLAVERDSLPFTNPDDDVYYDNENYDVLNDAPLPMLTDLYLKKMRSEKLLENSAATLEFLMIKCVRFMEYFEGRNVKLAKVHTVLMIDDGERYTDKHRK